MLVALQVAQPRKRRFSWAGRRRETVTSRFVQACGGQFQVETQADLFTALVSFPLDASPSDPR